MRGLKGTFTIGPVGKHEEIVGIKKLAEGVKVRVEPVKAGGA